METARALCHQPLRDYRRVALVMGIRIDFVDGVTVAVATFLPEMFIGDRRSLIWPSAGHIRRRSPVATISAGSP
jgi:hypothetical protein